MLTCFRFSLALSALLPLLLMAIPSAPVAVSHFEAWRGLTASPSSLGGVLPMEGSGAATFLSPGAFILPVDFTREPVAARASWDLKIPCDLKLAQGLEFDFYCSDLTPFSRFSLYLRSGSGWYHLPFFPETAGKWERIRVLKRSAQIEAPVSGWGNIDSLRLSGWRGGRGGARLAIANLSPIPVSPGILILQARGEKSRDVMTFSGNMASTLAAIGLPPVEVADGELDGTLLEHCRLVILPYNPTLTPESALLLRRFIDRKGKLLVCYRLPSPVDELLGIREKGYCGVEAWDGMRLRGFVRVGKGLPGQPAFVPQASWCTALPEAGGECETLALWMDGRGRRSGIPALVRSPNGIFMSHVWLGGTRGEQAALVRSMVGSLFPDTLRQGAGRALSGIGADLPPSDFERIKAGKELGALIDRATSAWKAGKWQRAIDLAEQASAEATRRWLSSRPSQRDTFRGFWCHSPWGLGGGRSWDDSIRLLKEGGFNAVVVNLAWADTAFYDSAVLPVSPLVKERGDPLKAVLAACRRYGVACHVWKVCWNMGTCVSRERAARLSGEGRTVWGPDGREIPRWLCPTHPLNRRREIEAMVELARKGVDGIHFDYIRYPTSKGCFCQGCRRRFEQKIGRKVREWPSDLLREGELSGKWKAFCRDAISSVVRSVRERVRETDGSVQISAAVFRNPGSLAQEWPLWCEKGWLDFISPMDYVESPVMLENLIRQQKGRVAGVRLYPGIGLSCWPAELSDPVMAARQIEAVRRAGLQGFMIFNLDSRAEKVIPLLRLGVTRADAL